MRSFEEKIAMIKDLLADLDTPFVLGVYDNNIGQHKVWINGGSTDLYIFGSSILDFSDQMEDIEFEFNNNLIIDEANNIEVDMEGFDYEGGKQEE